MYLQLAELLHTGIKELHLPISNATQAKMLEYVELLCKWNKTYNLTSIRDPKDIVVRHILDSLAIVPFVQGERVLDVGTGAGLPGIPLALALPQKQFVLLDSNSKKTRFLNFVVISLKIPNVEVIQERVEKYQPQQKFDTIITRAFSALNDMIVKTKYLFNPDGTLLAMKGKHPETELEEISQTATVHKLHVPFLAEERNLVCIKGIVDG